jgi:iron complex outermembrane receptor protein
VKKGLLLLVALFAVSYLSGTARGEEVPRVSEIVVEETEEAKALQERKESSYAKTVITRQEMEELGGQTAADVLRRLPRLYFSGPPATNKDIRQAGLDKEFQNVLINGHRPPGGGEKREFALDRIPVEQIERIEILKNPTAAYDADAVAGLVNIILKEAPRQRTLSATAGGNYNDAAQKPGSKLTLEYGDEAGPFGYLLGGTRNDEYRGKDKGVTDTDKNEREAEDETVRTITSSANLALSLRAGERDRLVFKPFLSDQAERKSKEKLVSELTTGAARSLAVEHENKDILLQSYALEWEHRFAGGAALKLQGLLSENEEEKKKDAAQFKGATLAFDKNVFEAEEKEDQEKVAAADLRLPLPGPFDTAHLVSLGAKLRDKDRKVEKEVFEVNAAGAVKVTSTPNDSYSVDETITALYLMDEASLTERLVLTPGMRVELTEGEYETAGGAQDSDDFTDWNPSLHALYKLGGGYQLRGSVARTISRPAFKDKVPTFTAKPDKVEVGNPDLEAATSVNYEAGIEKYLGKTGLVAVGGFWKEIDDVIEKQQVDDDFDDDPLNGLQPVIQPVNAGEATVKGIEVEARSSLAFLRLPDVMVSANYTRMKSKVKDVNTGETRPLADVPEDLANLIVRYASKPLGLAASLGVNYIGEKINESDPTKPKKVEEPFVQWDASITKTLTRQLSLYTSAINLFDERKEKKEGNRRETEEVGRTFLVGLRYEL